MEFINGRFVVLFPWITIIRLVNTIWSMPTTVIVVVGSIELQFKFLLIETPHDLLHNFATTPISTCHNLSLKLATKARGLQGCRPRGRLGVTSHAPKSAKSVREWTLTLPNELPLWELESQMDSQIFRTQFQGSKPIKLNISLYHLKAIET
jgi:hypothetical protein